MTELSNKIKGRKHLLVFMIFLKAVSERVGVTKGQTIAKQQNKIPECIKLKKG